ncbi:biotin/lipoyl-containing protein, partial [Turicimonas muris]|uniref:biotin/lipoyl-containing protein n=1 Tax=Turicimonas muris TaxID=1796652 RepID=UPI00261F3BF3
MAIIEVVVPELSESVSEASLIEWKKKVGDRVSADEVLIEIETDKIVMEVPAPESGVLVSIQQGNGASVTGGQLLATIDTSAAASAEVSAPKQAAPQQPAPIQHASAPQPTAPAAAAVAAAAETAAPSVKVMPSAAKMMANLGLNPADVVGSGKGGRITKEDVRNTHPQPAAKSVQVQAPVLQSIVSAQPSSLREEKRVPMSRLRARVAERLIKSQSDAAILTTFNEVNLGPVMALRAKYKESFEKKYGMKPVDYRMKLKEKGEMCWKINTGLSSVEEQVAAMKEAEKFNEETGLNISMAHQLPQNITGVPKEKREGLPISLGFMLNEPEDWEAITMASSVSPVFGDNHLGWPNAVET